jgi:hypothetical protein
MIDQVLQTDLTILKVALDVLLNPAGDQESERDEGVLLKELEHVINERLHLLTIFTFVEPVDNNKERTLEKGRFEEAAALGSKPERLIQEAAKLGD